MTKEELTGLEDKIGKKEELNHEYDSGILFDKEQESMQSYESSNDRISLFTSDTDHEKGRNMWQIRKKYSTLFFFVLRVR